MKILHGVPRNKLGITNLLGGVILFAAGLVQADIVTENGACLDPASGVGNNCTANDVGEAFVQSITRADGSPLDSCIAGENIDVLLSMGLTTTANERYDLHTYISLDGDQSAKTGDSCQVQNLNGTNAPQTFLDGDACVDSQAADGQVIIPLDPITIPCTPNEEGKLVVDACFSWDNRAANTCSATPNTKSKCKCDEGIPTDVTVLGAVYVEKASNTDEDFQFSVTGAGVVDGGAIFDLADGDPKEKVEVEIDFNNGNAITISEPFTAGFDQSYSCSDGSTGMGTEVTVNLSYPDVTSVSCLFTNNAIPPKLTLVKDVTNDNGGTAQAAEWTLTADGYNAVNPVPGTYDLLEVGPVGYEQTSLTCSNSNGPVSSVSLDYGDDVTCTFFNDDIAPKLTLIKEVKNNNGGAANAADWTLIADGYNADKPQIGTYDLSETGPSGYELTSLTCDNATGPVTSVTLGLGDDVTCTFINDDKAPGLTLRKVVKNDNGGEAKAADWALTADGYNAANPQTGTYELSESGPAGYKLTSLTCDNATGPVTSVTLGQGEDVTCTFVNDDIPAKLKLVKEVESLKGAPLEPVSDFPLFATGVAFVSGVGQEVNAGTYTLTETNNSDNYVLDELSCNNGTSTSVLNPKVTLGLGEEVTCTFINRDNEFAPFGFIKVVKKVEGGTASCSDFGYTISGNGLAPIVAQWDNTCMSALEQVFIGNYEVTENAFSVDYTKDESGCVSVSVTEANTITNPAVCTIVNKANQKLYPTRTIGYWKTHPESLKYYLNQSGSLGYCAGNTVTTVCDAVATLSLLGGGANNAKRQSLAAALNCAAFGCDVQPDPTTAQCTGTNGSTWDAYNSNELTDGIANPVRHGRANREYCR